MIEFIVFSKDNRLQLLKRRNMSRELKFDLENIEDELQEAHDDALAHDIEQVSEGSDAYVDHIEWKVESFIIPDDADKRSAAMDIIERASAEAERLGELSSSDLRLVYDAAYDKTRFYSSKKAIVSLENWKGAEFISASEAAALSLGKNPGYVTFERMRDEPASAFKEMFLQRLKLIEDAIEAGELKPKMRPKHIRHFIKEPDKIEPTQKLEVDFRERPIFYSLLLLLATKNDRFTWDPLDKQKWVPQELAAALQGMGLKGNVVTLRKHLRAAVNWAHANGKAPKRAPPK